MIRGIHIVYKDARFVILDGAGESDDIQRRSNAIALLRADVFLQNMPGDGPIKSTGVDVDKIEAPGKLSCNTAFSRGSRTINGDYTIRARLGSVWSHVYLVPNEIS